MTLDDREKAFEAKYGRDQEKLFRIYARRAKLVGLWAAEHLGLTGEEAEAYAKQIVAVDFDEPGHMDMVRRIRADFDAKGVDISDHRIEKEMSHFLELATQQVEAT